MLGKLVPEDNRMEMNKLGKIVKSYTGLSADMVLHSIKARIPGLLWVVSNVDAGETVVSLP